MSILVRSTLSALSAMALVIPAEARQIENRQLTWADFRGEPEADSPYDAYTFWSVHYSYDAPTRDGEGFRLNVRVWNQLDGRSWVKPQVARDPSKRELLNHEQGHYTIGVICALAFKRAVAEHRFGSHYQAELRDLFD